MTHSEPKTRHLTRAELSRVLRDLHEPDPDPAPSEPKTTLWTRPEPLASHRSPEPVTQLEVQLPQEGKVRSASPEGKVETDRMSSRLAHSRAVITRIGIGVLAAGCAWWVGLRPPPPSNVSAEAVLVAAPADALPSAEARAPAAIVPVAPTVDEPPPQRAVDAEPPSRRAAVDLLLAGRQREALDAYRALVLAEPNEASFAALVMQLERELTNCDKESGPCAR